MKAAPSACRIAPAGNDQTVTLRRKRDVATSSPVAGRDDLEWAVRIVADAGGVVWQAGRSNARNLRSLGHQLAIRVNACVLLGDIVIHHRSMARYQLMRHATCPFEGRRADVLDDLYVKTFLKRQIGLRAATAEIGG